MTGERIPAPGFTKVSGTRGPPKGESYFVQCRNGRIDKVPWPAEGPRWKHNGSEWDVIAVKRA